MQVTGFQGVTPHLITRKPPAGSGNQSSGQEKRVLRSQEPGPTKREILNDAFRTAQRKVPTLNNTGPLASFRAVDAVRFLNNRTESRNLPAVENQDKTSRFTDLKIKRLNAIRISLNNLERAVSRLEAAGGFNTRASKSSRSSIAVAYPGPSSPVTDFSVRVTQLAQNNVLVSDEQTSPQSALGLSGSFIINGFEVDVVSTDTLFDIRDNINFGEDRNKNGILDLSEDLNGNGESDIINIEPSGFGPGVYIVEDLDGNGTLNSAEDTNGNGRLDGGVLETAVVAAVVENRLKLRSIQGGDTKIDLLDNDDILLSLGFFEKDKNDLPVLKEIQLDTGNPPTNQIVSPQTAEIEVEGTKVTGATNTFTKTVEDTALSVKSASSKKAQISIFIDTQVVISQIRNLFKQFNNAVRTINASLTDSPAFRSDPDIQDIRNDLTFSPQEETRKLAARNEKIDRARANTINRKSIGIGIANTGKKEVDEIAVTSIVGKMKDEITRPFKNTDRDLLNRLTSVGIRSRKDDTFQVDKRALKQALEKNTDEVVALFTDSETGILPALGRALSGILKGGSGDLDQKLQKVVIAAGISGGLSEGFRIDSINSTVGGSVQSLITGE